MAQRLEVRHAGDVRAVARLELDRQLFAHDAIGDVVENDIDTGIFLHESVDKILQDLALDAVGIPHDADVPGDCGRRRQKPDGECREHRSGLASLIFLLLCASLLPLADKRRAGFPGRRFVVIWRPAW